MCKASCRLLPQGVLHCRPLRAGNPKLYGHRSPVRVSVWLMPLLASTLAVLRLLQGHHGGPAGAAAAAALKHANPCASCVSAETLHFYYRANTVGLLALLANCLSFAAYLCVLQQFLARRPHPFSAFLAASIVGGAGIAALAAPDFKTVSLKFATSQYLAVPASRPWRRPTSRR